MISFSSETRCEIIRGLPFEDYRTLLAINQSLLKTHDVEYDGCPALYFYRSQFSDDRDSSALSQGRQFHCRLLEPHTFKDRYLILDDSVRDSLFLEIKSDGLKRKSKSEYMKHDSFNSWYQANGAKGFTTTSAFKSWAGGDAREVVTEERLRQLDDMADAILNNSEIADELDAANLTDCEVTALAPIEFRDGTKLQLKARNDILCVGDAIIDAKTCRSTNPRKFAAAVVGYGYDIQAAFYKEVTKLAGIEKKRFGFLAQEKTPPYLNCIHWMHDGWMKYGRIRYKKILGDIAESIRRDYWPNPSSGILEPPQFLQPLIEAIE